MTYWAAVRKWFVGFLTSWRHFPEHEGRLLERLCDALWALYGFSLMLFGPVLALLAPLGALLLLADERKRARERAEFERQAAASVTGLRQKERGDA